MYYHGWPSSRLQARLAHWLALDRGIRLLALDRPGMGRSSFVRDRTLDDWPPMVGRFADSLGIEKFGQLGVSGGGPYVLACAARFPQRIAGSAVLAGAVPLPTSWRDQSGLHPAYRMMIPFRWLPGFCFSPMFRLAAWASNLPPDKPPMAWALASLASADRALLLDHPEIWPVITRSFREGVGSGNGRGIMADAEIYFQPLPFDRTAVHAPIHYWHGADDRNIPLPMVREFTAAIPGATLEVDPALGHFSLVLRKAAAALDVLTSCAEQPDR